jgi:membrane associated rhomboid family serine protease
MFSWILVITLVLSWQGFKNQRLKQKMLFSPYRVSHYGELWRLVSHAFVHADTAHLLINMFVLYSFAPLLESIMGQPQFLALYFGGILAASVPAMITKKNRPEYASLGASGAVAAVIFAFIVRFPAEQLLLFFIIPIPAWLAGIGYLAYEYYQTGKRSRIAHDAHLGGAVYGIAFTAWTVPGSFPAFLTAIMGG